jgi:hypothetical protein
MQPFLKRMRLAYTKRLLWRQNRAEPSEAEPGQAIQARKTISIQKKMVSFNKTAVFHEK